MSIIKTKDGVEIFYKDWEKVSPSCSATAGRYHPMTGIRRCCSFSSTAVALSRTIAVDTVALRK